MPKLSGKSAAARASKTGGSQWKVFLQPGWVFTVILVITFSYFAFTVLSPWQLNKDSQIVDRNEHVEQAFKQDPLPYDEIFDASGSIRDDNEWMRVSITGQYLNDASVVLRLRPVESTPAYQSLVPFQLESGEIIVVNRGFEPAPAGHEVTIAPAPSGEVTIVAHARRNEVLPQTAPMLKTDEAANGLNQVYGINTQQIGEITELQLAEDYLQLSADQPGSLNAIPIPKLDRGNHLSYGFQWIAFGIMAPLGLLYFIRAEIRERRRVREEEAEMAQLSHTAQEQAEQEQATQQQAQQDASDLSLEDAAPSPSSVTTESDAVADAPPAEQAPRTPSTRSRYGTARPQKWRKADRRRDEF